MQCNRFVAQTREFDECVYTYATANALGWLAVRVLLGFFD